MWHVLGVEHPIGDYHTTVCPDLFNARLHIFDEDLPLPVLLITFNVVYQYREFDVWEKVEFLGVHFEVLFEVLLRRMHREF
jgi:hypothetical protein